MTKNNALKLVASLALPQIAGGLGALFTASAIPTWYTTIEKPALNPPSWIFGPVWTILYLLMGVSAFLVWRKGLSSPGVKKALSIFLLQLGLNAFWSIAFFGLENPGLALINIGLLWISIVWTMFAFWKISRPATYLLVPYLLWVSFATYLNASIYILN